MAKRDLTFVSMIEIFFKGIKYYFLNFEKFMKYLAFPVFGQVAGITIIFTAAYLYTILIPKLTQSAPIFDNILFVFLLLLVITLPGFFIFCKAFWDYLVAMAALNSMASYIIESNNKIEDTSIADGLIKNRSFSYVMLLILLSIIYIVGSFPLLWAIMAIGFVYLSLTFQAFALEENISPFGAISLSVNLIKHNFLKTLFLLAALGIFTYWLIPSLICWGVEAGNLLGFFSYPVERFVTMLPLDELNAIIAAHNLPFSIRSVELSKFITLSVVAFMVTAFTLPIRSICCTMLFKELHSRNYAGKIAAEKLVKRATKKIADKDGE